MNQKVNLIRAMAWWKFVFLSLKYCVLIFLLLALFFFCSMMTFPYQFPEKKVKYKVPVFN